MGAVLLCLVVFVVWVLGDLVLDKPAPPDWNRKDET
jgi:hypothetical protein